MLNPNEQTGKPAKSKSVSRKPVKAKLAKAKPAKVVKLEQEEEDYPEVLCFRSGEPPTISLEAFRALEKRLERPGRYIPALAEAMKRMRENTTDG